MTRKNHSILWRYQISKYILEVNRIKIYFKYYGEALAKVAVGGFLIGMGTYLVSNGCFLYGAHKLLLNAYGLDKDATMAFVNAMQEKIGK